MIPKVIHYCWFGHNPLPKLASQCIASWRQHMPDYEIIEWNEDNFDVNMTPYSRDAYAAGKYAFVSDFARFWILYKYGGIYFDTDVEALQPIDPILKQGAFMGVENQILRPTDRLRVAPGLGLACEAGMPVIGDIINMYKNTEFKIEQNGSFITVVTLVSNFLYQRGLLSTNEIQNVEGLNIYPAEYFAARSNGEMVIKRTQNSYCIHHYAMSWTPKSYQWKKRIQRHLPHWFNHTLITIKRFLLG